VNGNHDLCADGDPEQTLVADRYGSIVDLYVLLQRPDGKILLLERSGTGYADGQLCPPSVHLASRLSDSSLSGWVAGWIGSVSASVWMCAVRSAWNSVGCDQV
jgi:hypothetical protein